ncbi:MAG: hypothetical protein WHV44_06350, partial [Anaerolineales bacterium]
AYTVDFHQRVRAGYHALAAQEPDRWRVVDASQPWEQVQHALRQTILAALTHQ